MTNKTSLKHPMILGLMMTCGVVLTGLQSRAQNTVFSDRHSKEGDKIQNVFTRKEASSNNFFHRLGGYIMGPSWHSNRNACYNEFNPGGALTYRLGKLDDTKTINYDVVGGGYYNSLRRLTVILGLKAEMKIGHSPISVGLTGGFMTYPKYLADAIITYNTVYSNSPEEFKNSSQKGIHKSYSDIEGGANHYYFNGTNVKNGVSDQTDISRAFHYLALETVEDNRARAEGPTVLKPAVLPFVKANITKNIGLMIQGGPVPKSGLVFNAAVVYSPGI